MTDTPYTKADYRAAHAALLAASAALLATDEYSAVSSAQARLDEIEDEMPDLVGRCEGCDAAIFEDEPYSHDSVNDIVQCEACSPTWADLLTQPESFYRDIDGDEVYFTAESARLAADEYVASGGSLDDKFCLTMPKTGEA